MHVHIPHSVKSWKRVARKPGRPGGQHGLGNSIKEKLRERQETWKLYEDKSSLDGKGRNQERPEEDRRNYVAWCYKTTRKESQIRR